VPEAFVKVQGHDADADNVGVAAFGSFIVTECVGELGIVVLVEDRQGEEHQGAELPVDY
jgi:hypothetical protein